MSKRSKNVSKNLILTLIARLSYLLIGFLTRKLIIQLIDVEYLGLTSLYSNMLDFLNLAELGIGVAIQVRLYGPLVDGDNDKIYNLIKVAQKVYTLIGIFVLIAGGASSFILQYLIKDNPFSIWYVRLAYIISVAGISFSYFCASKRLYFESNEKFYIITLSDLVVKVLFTAAGLLALYLTREYLLYAAFIAVQSTLSNIFLAIYYKVTCPHLRSGRNDKDFQKSEQKIVTKSLKDVVPMKLGVYIFSSTDSIVITSFIGLTASAIYSNYNLLSLSLLSISTMVSNALVSTFGKMEKENPDRNYMLKRYKMYENIQYMFAIFSAVCLILLYDRFMTAWVGNEYLIGRLCVVLLSLDYLIHSSFQPLSTLYTSTGKFKEDKICSLIAAGMNIGLSILLVLFIGLPGVIIGTLTANIFTFIVRNYIINKKYFNRSFSAVVLKPLLAFLLFCVETVICYFAICYVHLSNKWLDFIVAAIICIIITNIFNLLIAKKLGYLDLFIKKFHIGEGRMTKAVKKVLRPIYHKYKSAKATKSIKKNFKIERNEKISIVFICQVQHIWNKMQPLVDCLLKDKSFKLALFFVPDPKEDDNENNIFKDYAKEYNIEFYEYEPNLLEKLSADYVVYPRPYDDYLPEDIRSSKAVYYARLAYIPYGYSTMELGKVNLNFCFTRNIALFFADMGYSFDYFNKSRSSNVKKGIQKSFDLGYPYLEYLCEICGKPSENSAFAKLQGNGLKIIWTPRWTNDEKLGGSNFFRYIDKFFDEFVGKEKYKFVFRPHPYAFDNYVAQGLMTEQQKEDYLSKIANSANSVYDNDDDYFDTLKDADIAIMDVSSIVPERVMTGKPVIFCHNEGTEVLNDKMKEMTRYMYNAYSFEDIENYIGKILSGNDFMKDDREKYCKEFRESMVGTCERYKKAIKEDYNLRVNSKKEKKL